MYLSHTLVLKGCAVALGWLFRRASWTLPGRTPTALSFALLGIIVSIVFAIACYALLEQPIARYLGGLLRRKQDIKLQNIYSTEVP
jgi:peptidoglycan/LPS O-acetylase OafA/YrhL